MTEIVKGMKITPWGTKDNPLMQGMFVGCVQWAIGDKDIVESFKKDTGNDLNSLRFSGIDGMIDEATGRAGEMFAAFADYVAENIWGDENSDIDAA
jgi:hypothetical protein